MQIQSFSEAAQEGDIEGIEEDFAEFRRLGRLISAHAKTALLSAALTLTVASFLFSR